MSVAERAHARDVDKQVSRAPAIHALLSLLEAHGVKEIFGVPGGPLTSLFEALGERGKIRFVMAKHEAGAAYMAAMSALVTGRLAVCCGTSGPGATNALTGIAVAQTNSLPLLFLSGQVSTEAFGTGAIQESSDFATDLVALFSHVTKLSVRLPSAERMPEVVRQLIRTAKSGKPGPVHLNLPANLLATEIPFPGADSFHGAENGSLQDPAHVVAMAGVHRAASLLRNAERVVLLAGHGVRLAKAEDELAWLARSMMAKVITTPKGKGLIAEDDPCFSGILGFGGHERAKAALEKADAVLILGSSLGEFVLLGKSLPVGPECQVIHVDIDGSILGRGIPGALTVESDARAFLVELAVELSERGPDTSGLVRIVDEEVPDSDASPLSMDPSSGDSSEVSSHALILGLRQALADEDFLLVDIGTSTLWSLHNYTVKKPGTFFTELGFGCMGVAVAGAIGAALARPERRTVALVGDSAFSMHGLEVHTAVELGLPIVWVVLNNSGHGMVFQGDHLMRGRDLGASRFQHALSAKGIAQALGAKGLEVGPDGSLDAVLEQALQSKLPTVIDVKVPIGAIPPTLTRRVEGLANYIGKPPSFRMQPK